MMHKATGLLGIAARARCLAYGEGVLKSIQQNKAKLVIVTTDCGENMRKKYIDKCNYYKIPICFMDGKELSCAIGKENRKAIAVLDIGFAKKLQTYLKG